MGIERILVFMLDPKHALSPQLVHFYAICAGESKKSSGEKARKRNVGTVRLVRCVVGGKLEDFACLGKRHGWRLDTGLCGITSNRHMSKKFVSISYRMLKVISANFHVTSKSFSVHDSNGEAQLSTM